MKTKKISEGEWKLTCSCGAEATIKKKENGSNVISGDIAFFTYRGTDAGYICNKCAVADITNEYVARELKEMLS